MGTLGAVPYQIHETPIRFVRRRLDSCVTDYAPENEVELEKTPLSVISDNGLLSAA